MKKVEATINPARLEEVCEALVEEGIHGVNACEVRRYDPGTPSYWYRGSEYAVAFTPRVKIETVIDDIQVARCIAAITRTVSTDDADQIAVYPIEDSVRIRTGERPARAA